MWLQVMSSSTSILLTLRASPRAKAPSFPKPFHETSSTFSVPLVWRMSMKTNWHCYSTVYQCSNPFLPWTAPLTKIQVLECCDGRAPIHKMALRTPWKSGSPTEVENPARSSKPLSDILSIQTRSLPIAPKFSWYVLLPHCWSQQCTCFVFVLSFSTCELTTGLFGILVHAYQNCVCIQYM